MKQVASRIAAVCMLLDVASCSVEDEPLGPISAQPTSSSPAPGAPAAPACPDVPTTVFAASCTNTNCHGVVDPASGLDLKTMGVASRLVNVPAKSGGLLIDPKSVESSVIYKRLLPSAGVQRMPMAAALDDAQIVCVHSWIEAQIANAGSISPSPAPTSITPTPVPTGTTPGPTTGTTTIRIAAGAITPYTDTKGNVWSADTGFTGGKTNQFPPAAISGTDAPQLYSSERYADPSVSGTFSYSLAVTKGRYTVTLKFAENYFGQAGQRVFDVAINGTTVLPGFDVVAAAGGKEAAVDKAFPVDMAADGPIDITFTQGPASGPKVSAIEVVPAP